MNNQGGAFRKKKKDNGDLSWDKIEPKPAEPKPKYKITEENDPEAACSFCGLPLQEYSEFNAHSLGNTAVMCSMCIHRMATLANSVHARHAYEDAQNASEDKIDLSSLKNRIRVVLGTLPERVSEQLAKLVLRMATRNAAKIAEWRAKGAKTDHFGIDMTPIRAALVGPNAADYLEPLRRATHSVGIMLAEALREEAGDGEAKKRLSWKCMDDPAHTSLGCVFFLDGYVPLEGDFHVVSAVEDGFTVPRGVWKIVLNQLPFDN